MKAAILLATLAVTGACHAAPTDKLHLQVHGVSYHFSDRRVGDWNPINLGLGLRYAFSKTYSVQLGRYRNSDSMSTQNFYTNYFLGDYTPLHLSSVQVGLFVGVGTGYNKYRYTLVNNEVKPVVIEKRTSPLGGAVARWQGERVNLTLRLIPKVSNGSAAVGLEAGYRF